MTDQTILAGISPEEAKKAREWALHALNKPGASTTAEKAVARVVIGTVPEPRPTLADMTPVARRGCQWMQCEVHGKLQIITLILDDSDHSHAVTLDPSGYISRCPLESVTPRPDLPRLEWPGDTPTGPDHLAVGTVIESADDPRIAALPVGSILLDRRKEATIKRIASWAGAGYIPIPSEGAELGPWTVLHIPKEDDQ